MRHHRDARFNNRFRTAALFGTASLAGAAALIAASSVSVLAAPPAKKAAAKGVKAAAPSGPIVLGTTQMPGDFGKFGQTYTMGKDYPLNFTLTRAEYTVEPITIGARRIVPKADEKLLVLHYTVHNPKPLEQRYYWADLKFTAVDALDVNREFTQYIAREGTADQLSVTLKPAQKVEVYTVIIVPAKGETPKLIVMREQGQPVVRYDLRGKVKALPAAFAEPGDASLMSAAKQVAAKLGDIYPMGIFDARLDTLAYTTEPIKGNAPAKGKRFLSATFTIKNRASASSRYYWADFHADLRDADGEKIPYNQYLMKATRDELASGNADPGEEVRVRFFWELPENVDGKTLLLSEAKEVSRDQARVFAFDVTGAVATTAAAK